MGAAVMPEERASHCVRLTLHPEYGVSQLWDDANGSVWILLHGPVQLTLILGLRAVTQEDDLDTVHSFMPKKCVISVTW